MPEIKHTFTGGKMNKSLDERLVPNGEYRDALNVQVRTTDGNKDGMESFIKNEEQDNSSLASKSPKKKPPTNDI